tara:strand:+ start:972 stop:1472 length:501 start_codon:yes stop_codon:yes gene_type:complete
MSKKAKKTKTVKTGDTISLHYVGKFPDGEQFDSSYDRGEPVKVEVGAGTLIEGFDSALVGMKVGETRHIEVPKEKGYGDLNPNAFIEVDKSTFPNDFPFEKGAFIPLTNDEGAQFVGRLDEVVEDTVRVDLNHPMAGKDLEFDIEVVGIETDTDTTTTTTTTTTTE